MPISAKWYRDSANSTSFEGIIIRDGIDSPSTGYRFDNLGLVYLDKNGNSRIDSDDLVIGSIVDTQSGGSGSLLQDPKQSTLYSIKDYDNSTKSAGIAVIFDEDFNSGKAVAPPKPKVTAVTPVGGSTNATSGAGSAVSTTVPGIFSGTTSSSTTSTPNTTSSPTAGIASSGASSSATTTDPSVSTIGTTPGTSNTPINSIYVSPTTSNSTTEIPAIWDKLTPTTTNFISDVGSYFIPTNSSAVSQQISPVGKQLDLRGFGLNYTANVTSVIKAKSTRGDVLLSPEGLSTSSLSMLLGDKGNDIIRGAAGTDLIDGGRGNDIIKAGDGDDIITGGRGSDQVWGGFGKNIFLGERDGAIDRLYITSDQFVPNPNKNNTAGNNLNGLNTDTIISLDPYDKITILGVTNQDLAFFETLGPSGVQGIGIFAKGSLEAIYTGNDLSIQQISSMTTASISGYSDVINSL